MNNKSQAQVITIALIILMVLAVLFITSFLVRPLIRERVSDEVKFSPKDAEIGYTSEVESEDETNIRIAVIGTLILKSGGAVALVIFAIGYLIKNIKNK